MAAKDEIGHALHALKAAQFALDADHSAQALAEINKARSYLDRAVADMRRPCADPKADNFGMCVRCGRAVEDH